MNWVVKIRMAQLDTRTNIITEHLCTTPSLGLKLMIRTNEKRICMKTDRCQTLFSTNTITGARQPHSDVMLRVDEEIVSMQPLKNLRDRFIFRILQFKKKKIK